MNSKGWILGTLLLGTFLVVGCGGEDEGDDSTGGTGGGTMTGGSGGASGSAGATGGATMTGGSSGSAGSSAGGMAGSAGSSGGAETGGMAGSAGSSGGAGTGGMAGGTAGSAGGTCTLQVDIPDCDSCIAENCVNECNTCAGNEECVALWDCITASCIDANNELDGMCSMGCVTKHPTGASDFGALWQGMTPGCMSSNCSNVCPIRAI